MIPFNFDISIYNPATYTFSIEIRLFVDDLNDTQNKKLFCLSSNLICSTFVKALIGKLQVILL